jgi:hypothetical protein
MNSPRNILSLIENSLRTASSVNTQATLGNRQTYLGMSDLAQGLSCPRHVVANKLAAENPTANLDRLLQLERGHWLEDGLGKAFKASGHEAMAQLEISVIHRGVPVKAHLDLVLHDPQNHGVSVLEVKSLAKIRETVFETHQAQLLGQISLLDKFWDWPVFRLEAESNPMSFPKLAKTFWNADLSDRPAVTGHVLTVSPDRAKAFGPYMPNGYFLDRLLDNGAEIWCQLDEVKKGKRTLSDVPFNDSFWPLCDYCGHNRDCPKFIGEECLALEPELATLAQLRAGRKRMDDEIRDRESWLKSLAALMRKTNQWITARGYRFKVSVQKGRQSLDQDILKERLGVSAGLDDESLESILAESRKEGQPFERFLLSPLN